jgi:hypothetical protein
VPKESFAQIPRQLLAKSDSWCNNHHGAWNSPAPRERCDDGRFPASRWHVHQRRARVSPVKLAEIPPDPINGIALVVAQRVG